MLRDNDEVIRIVINLKNNKTNNNNYKDAWEPSLNPRWVLNPKIGGFYPQKWMVYNNASKPYEQMDDLGGYKPLFLVQHPR